jgi:hypothetical protein
MSGYITNAATYFGSSAPSAGSFDIDIAFAKVIKYEISIKERIAV